MGSSATDYCPCRIIFFSKWKIFFVQENKGAVIGVSFYSSVFTGDLLPACFNNERLESQSP
jgi:hypothetical protein